MVSHYGLSLRRLAVSRLDSTCSEARGMKGRLVSWRGGIFQAQISSLREKRLWPSSPRRRLEDGRQSTRRISISHWVSDGLDEWVPVVSYLYYLEAGRGML